MSDKTPINYTHTPIKDEIVLRKDEYVVGNEIKTIKRNTDNIVQEGTIIGESIINPMGEALEKVVDKTNSFLNSDYSDANRFVGNTKLGNDGQNASLWASGTPTDDTANKVLGKSSVRFTTVVGTVFPVKNNLTSIDYTKLSNGEDSPDSDFIILELGIDDVSQITSIDFRVSTEPVTGGNLKLITLTGLQNGFKQYVLKKSDFGTLGTGADFSDIQAISLRVQATGVTNVYFQYDQLVKADPDNPNIPNPFQENGKRVWSPNAGEYYVGPEFGENIIRELTKDISSNSLGYVKEFENFIASAVITSQSATRVDGFAWHQDNNNYILILVRDDKVRISKIENTSFSFKEEDFPIDIGDTLYFELKKEGNNLIGEIVNQKGNRQQVVTTTTLTGAGTFAINQNGGNYLSTYKSLSITEIPYAFRSGYASRAGSLDEQAKAIATLSGAQPISSGVFTGILLDTEDAKNFGFALTSSGELEALFNGDFKFTAECKYDVNSSGVRDFLLQRNGSGIDDDPKDAPTNSQSKHRIVIDVFGVQKGDKFRIVAFQNVGIGLNVNSATLSITSIV